MKAVLSLLLLLTLGPSAPLGAAETFTGPPVSGDSGTLIWDSPSVDARGSMPIGNGDIGVNVWAEENGDLMLYLGKTDAWDEQSRLLKLGRLRVHFDNNPFAKGMSFRQELVLRSGEIRIEAGRGTNAVRIRLWVDAHNPAVHLEAEADQPFAQSVRLEPLRTERRRLTGSEKHAVDGLSATEPPMQYPDVVVDTAKQPGLTQQMVWYHRNEVSVHPATLKLQELDPARCAPDPLLGRTFGCAVEGGGLVTTNPCLLETARPVARTHIVISPLTLQSSTAEAWLKALAEQETRSRALDLATARAAHQRWWAEFWQRSWVRVSGGNAQETRAITLGWHLNRYLTACTARGNAPVKFNGAIFNVDGIDADGSPAPGNSVDARTWGGCLWFQNQRHIYWPMIEAGDYEQLLPFFKMYRDALPLAMERTKTYYQHEGAVFPETMYFWGAYANNGDVGYGWDRRGKELGLTDNGYIRRYWQGGLELIAMMLEYYRHTQDSQFASHTLLPLAVQIVTFYDQHYRRDAQGKLRLEPAQVLETV
jgi:alpha-L-fucosidase 2